jgi:hypothetical protein
MQRPMMMMFELVLGARAWPKWWMDLARTHWTGQHQTPVAFIGLFWVGEGQF